MDSARFLPKDRIYFAVEFSKLDPSQIEQMREQLACIGCGASAYFVPPTRAGTCFFGARPHRPGCELTTNSRKRLIASIPTDEARELDKDTFRLRPHRIRAEGPQSNVDHDPAAASHRRAHNYQGEHGGRRTTASVGLRSLLRKLLADPEFAASSTTLELDGRKSTVRNLCVNVADASEQLLKRKKLFWGTIHYAKTGTQGGTWLYTERGLPNVLIKDELLKLVMADNKLDDLNGFAGASFLAYCWYNKSVDKELTYFSGCEPAWFVIIRDPEQPAND